MPFRKPYKNTYRRKTLKRVMNRKPMQRNASNVGTNIRYNKVNNPKLKASIVTPQQLQKATETQQIQRVVNLTKGRQYQFLRAQRQKLSTAPTIEFVVVRNVETLQLTTSAGNPNASFYNTIFTNSLVSSGQAVQLSRSFIKNRIVSVKVQIELSGQNLIANIPSGGSSYTTADQDIATRGVMCYLIRSNLQTSSTMPTTQSTWAEYPGVKFVLPNQPTTFSTKIPEEWPYTAVTNLATASPYSVWANQFSGVSVFSLCLKP